ncbi:MAG: hypothetical protein ACT4QD_21585 [Acidobacteriota bacterium]
MRTAFVRLTACGIVSIGLFVDVPAVRAQAWLPPQGEGAVAILYSDVFVKYHAVPTERVDAGHIFARTLLLDVTYGITDRVAVSFGIPWVASRYVGTLPHETSATDPTPNPLDDGRFHSTVQDFRFEVKYNLTRRGVVLTPFAATVIPSHEYRYFAHAAPGRHLREFQIGVAGAKTLDRPLPGLFVQARYAHGFLETVQDISRTRSIADVEIGYFINQRLRVLAMASGQATHGGVDVVRGRTRALLGPLWAYHDQIDRLNSLNVGAGAAVSITDTMDVFGSWTRTVAQRNGHVVDRGLSLGVSWGFKTGRVKDPFMTRAQRSLVKCLCQKNGK